MEGPNGRPSLACSHSHRCNLLCWSWLGHLAQGGGCQRATG